MCSIYLNNVCLAKAPYVNGYYLLNTEYSLLNVETSTKRKREDESSSFLWHYRLGHIGKGRISKLHKDGYLGSFDFKSFETCESFLTGKMTKAPFLGKRYPVNRAIGPNTY